MTAIFPQQVTASVYLGDIQAVQEAALAPKRFTHVVSVVDFDVEVPDGVDHHVIKVLDQDDANLLDCLDDAIEFIEEACDDDGKVLVHCVSGVSRSASVVVAFMCYSMGLSVNEALDVLILSCPQVSPNEGFIRQLSLYVDMGCEVDEDNEAYKRFKLIQRATAWEETGQYVDSDTLAQPEEQADSSATAQGSKFRCRKCRSLIATSRNIITVPDDAGGAASFSFRRKSYAVAKAAPTAESGSIFVEPMRWMVGIHAPAGKLYCPSCQAKLGQWCWHGMQAPNGVWVTPAFALGRSKLDELTPATPRPPAPSTLPASAAHHANTPDPEPTAPHISASSARDVQNARDVSTARGAGAHAALRPCCAAWFTHVVFDCDGVLVDSERASCEALRRAVLEVTGVDIPGSFPEDYYPVIGMDVASCIEHYNCTCGPGLWNVADVAERVAAVKGRHYEALTAAGIAAMPGVHAVVKELDSLGIRYAIGSSGSPEKISHNLTAAGLCDLFEPHLIVSAQHVARGKPAPDVYIEALRRLGCFDASHALVIEDSAHGLKAARGAGAYAVGVTNTLPVAALAPHADIVVGSLLDVDFGGLVP
eukprot:jgi/Ulvmu1/2571/UM014_0022.1